MQRSAHCVCEWGWGAGPELAQSRRRLSSPADDALHLDVLVLLLPPEPLLTLLQPRLVLQHQLLRRLLLALEQGLILFQLLGRDSQLVLQHRQVLPGGQRATGTAPRTESTAS